MDQELLYADQQERKAYAGGGNDTGRETGGMRFIESALLGLVEYPQEVGVLPR
jgi:hypothetical protein